MKHTLLKAAGIAAFSSLFFGANAAHWTLVSQVGTSSTVSSGATRGSLSALSVTIPSGSYAIYGTGTFKFFGEPDTFSTQISSTAYSFLFTFDPSVISYYTYVYLWVSDAPTDIPPTPGSSQEVTGYALQRATNLETVGIGMAGSSATYSSDALFNSVGPTWSGGGSPYTGFSNLWPKPTDSPIVSISSKNYYVRPVFVGGGPVSINGSGQTIVTISVGNFQSVDYATNVTANPNLLMELNSTSQTACYIAGSEVSGLPIR
jgi:hypothetical protein